MRQSRRAVSFKRWSLTGPASPSGPSWTPVDTESLTPHGGQELLKGKALISSLFTVMIRASAAELFPISFNPYNVPKVGALLSSFQRRDLSPGQGEDPCSK